MIRIYNTFTRRKEPLGALHDKLNMYVCGITAYDYCHVGHARVLVSFDIISRFVRHCGYHLTYARNITDIDDKILQRASAEKIHHSALTDRFITALHEDEQALAVLPPDIEPRATQHLSHIIAMIKVLIEKKYAYCSGGDVYFAVEQFPTYGKLARKDLTQLMAGARITPNPLKKNVHDFSLWKGSQPDEVGWDSPWGRGRPGWHIECSAMVAYCLAPSIDIHGGGPDLIFPHHENEIAQSEATYGQPFVRLWMHVGAVRSGEEKMSKSLGNFFTIRDVIQHYPAEALRYLFCASHYRSPIQFNDQQMNESMASLRRFYLALQSHKDCAEQPYTASDWSQQFTETMADDFNTPAALAVLFDMTRDLNSLPRNKKAAALVAELKHLSSVLGILQQAPLTFLRGDTHAAAIEQLIHERAAAKAAGDYERADAIRLKLSLQGVVLEDGRSGTTWRRTM